VLRFGGIGVEALAEVLGHPVDARVATGGSGNNRQVEFAPGEVSAPPAPGTLPSHYAPEATVEVVAADSVVERARALLAQDRRVGVLAPRRIEGLPAGTDALPPAGGAAAYAQCLYQRLREADRRGLDVLLAVPPTETGIGAAVADRLRRAASTA